ncbi:AAA family ATPase [Cohnella sp. CFH 77786]|uniref:LuxR C-terminal-related transcriptional regulator n=1 Tax=Cohnella sp. CFH 77786 TaxID=2662265 RepID=UPI001C60D4EB|nr:LuxR C-terminal-related transcriptional regulator [Cohnella sp. CFH 77786]MBW5447330.1 AAA family ATPase [Cohnella sp. CFH 77786]
MKNLSFEHEENYIVGRERERALFENFLNGNPCKPIWNIYGTGGVGKSTLLELYRELAERSGACFLSLDSRDFDHSEDGFCNTLLGRLAAGESDETGDRRPPWERLFDRLRQISTDRQVIVAIDTFEEMGDMEAWLRDRFLKAPIHLLLFAGRYPLKGGWLANPVLRSRIQWVALDGLGKEESLQLIERCGVADPDQADLLWRRSRGHPLTLSLSIAEHTYADDSFAGDPIDWFGEVFLRWMKEVPDPELRGLVELASTMRCFNLEMLTYVLEEPVRPEAFDRLIGLSFCRKTNRGWALHDLLADIAQRQIADRMPEQMKRWTERCAHYYADLIFEHSGKRNVAWEVEELFHYVGGTLHRTILSVNSSIEPITMEPLTNETLPEAVAYLEKCQLDTKPRNIHFVDPHTGEKFSLVYRENEFALAIKDLDVGALHALDGNIVKLLRSSDGELRGLSAIVPLHWGTMPCLERDPYSGPYFRSLSPAERQQFDVPSDKQTGWFIRSIFMEDVENPAHRAAMIRIMYTYMCAGGIFVASPPPTVMMRESHLSFGFEEVPGVVHNHYDGKTPTPTFVLDTREEKLREFLSRLLQQAGMDWKREERLRSVPDPQLRKSLLEPLTSREREVVGLALKGLPNADIGAALYISEVTVKKHFNSIYAKLGVNNRSNLIRKLMSDAE